MKVKAPNKDNLQKAYDEGCSDVKKVLENLYPDFFEKEEKFRIGDKLSVDSDIYGDIMIVSLGGGVAELIDLRDGYHIHDKFTPKDFKNITMMELRQSTNLDHLTFTKI